MSQSSDVEGLVALLSSCLALLVYDYMLTFDQEVDLVWSTKLNLGTVLFALNRYLPFIATVVSLYTKLVELSPKACSRYTGVYTWLIVIGIIIAEFILMLRTYAIWNRDRRMLIALSSGATLIFVIGIVTTQLEIESLKFVPGSYPGSVGCHVSSASTIIFASYLACFLCETVIFILTLVKAIAHLRRSRSPLVLTLYRDGIMFYVYCVTFSLANIILSVAGPGYLRNWLATPEHVIHSICCTRVLLFIFQYRREHDGTLTSATAGQSTSLSSQFFTSLLINHPTMPPPDECGDNGEAFAMADFRDNPHGVPPEINGAVEHRDNRLDIPSFQRDTLGGVSGFVQLRDDDEERGRCHDNHIMLESRIP